MPTITLQAATSRSILQARELFALASRIVVVTSPANPPIVIFVDERLVRHVEEVNGTGRDECADRGETEHEPHEEKDDRVDEQGKDHPKDDLHLSLGLELFPDDVFSQLGDVVHR